MMSTSTKVLIVGAGPAGLATAIGLAQHGIDFRIIDALPEAQNTSRAAVIHAATLDALKGLGVSEALITQGLKTPQFRVRDRDSVLLNVDFSRLLVSTPYALMIPQDETERILVARLKTLGHEVERPCRLSAIQREGELFRVLIDGENGRSDIVCRYLVGADGEKSTVRSLSGIGFPGGTYGSFLLADVRMDWPIAREEVTLFFSGDGTLVVAPMSQNRYRVVAQLNDAPAHPDVKAVQAVIDARGPRQNAHVTEVIWGSRFQVHHKLADTFHKEGALLIGDAAHVHSPAGGQGMNLGLRDAVALSEAIRQALAQSSGEALNRYADQRRAVAADMLKMTDRLTRVATLTYPLARWSRNRLIKAAGRVPQIRQLAARTLAGMSRT